MLALEDAFYFVPCAFDYLSQFILVERFVTCYLRDTCFVKRLDLFYLEVVADRVVYVAFAHATHHSFYFKDGHVLRAVAAS